MIDISELMYDPDFVQAVKLKTVTMRTQDFVPIAPIVDVTPIDASVQPADKDKLNPAIIDWSRAYKRIHSAVEMQFGQYVEYDGEDYKIVDIVNFGDNGYYEVIGEQTKEPLLVPLPPPPDPEPPEGDE